MISVIELQQKLGQLKEARSLAKKLGRQCFHEIDFQVKKLELLIKVKKINTRIIRKSKTRP